ncbi:MAG: tetratricopeptide repeat protein, partial [Myxococcales bacterium]|nr:tetratricopeptide repeat protein [Myxococcales bacterium]
MISTQLAPTGNGGGDGTPSDARGQPEPADDVVPSVGRTVGRYVIIGQLGRGGMGTVLKAYDEALDRAIALKLLHPGVAERHAERLTREAQALAKLSHPNVVHVYEVAEAEGQWFIAMELVHGNTLRRWQKTRRPWSEHVAAYLQAGEGLAAAHAQGLVHRDFKPDNCIVDDDGRVKVLDFGLVRELEPPAMRASDDSTEARAAAPPDERDEDEGNEREDDEDDPGRDPGLDSAGRGAASLVGSEPGASEGPLRGSGRISSRDSGRRASLTQTGTVLGTLAYMPLEQLEGHPVDARSDQFSFCVSLYEAVYGERPFPGNNAIALMMSLRRGDLRAAPRGARVPARLRRTLLRGLAQDPDERWPSMEPLLAELRRLVAPPRRTWPAIVVGGGLLAVAGGLWSSARGEPPCQGSAEQLATVWDDARRDELRSALLATELPYAADTWERVEQRLDDYAAAWVERHREVCEATNLRKEQSVEVMDLRMACLSTRRLELRETVRVLAHAKPTTVDRAVGMVAGLRGPSLCDDVEALQARLPPPDDPAVAREVEALRERLLRARSLRKAGEYEAGRAEVAEVVERAEAGGYAPLRAEAWLERGWLSEHTGRYAEAEDDLQQAYLLAAEHHHAAVEAEAVSALTAVVGRRRARYERGLQWGLTALALARGQRADPLAEANALMSIATVLHEQGALEQALQRYREGLAIEEAVLGPDHPAVGTMLNNLGAVLFTQGKLEQSLAHHRRALAIWEESLSPRHPYVGSSLNNIGEVLHRQGRLDDALSHFRAALEIWETALGPEHPHVAAVLTNLGAVWSDRGRPDQALADHRRALAIRRAALGERHPAVAESLALVAEAQWELGRPSEAAASAREALEVVQQGEGAGHPDAARA